MNCLCAHREALWGKWDGRENTKTLVGRTYSASRPSRLFLKEAFPALLIFLLTNVVLDWLSLVFRNHKILELQFQPRNRQLTSVFRGFLQSVTVNISTIRQIGPSLFPSTSYPIYYSLIILTLNATCSTSDSVVQ
jgi:hypothetical protein